MIAQDLWRAHYQILSIYFLKEFTELNVNFGHGDKKCETCGIMYKYCDCFLEYENIYLKYTPLILQNFSQILEKIKLNLLTDIDMLLMVEKDIRGGICHYIYWYAKANNKYMKTLIKIKNCHKSSTGM